MKSKWIQFLVMLLIGSSGGYSQETTWQSIDPGGFGWCMFTGAHSASGHLFWSTDMNLSLLRSTDQGETWEPIANPVAGTPFFVAGDPSDLNTLYLNQEGAGYKASGIWKSTDDGDTWTQICESEDFGINRSQSGAVDPENGKIIYWTGHDMGVRRSEDGGVTWEDISAGLPVRKTSRHHHMNYIKIDYNSPLENRRLYYPTRKGLYFMQEPEYVWKKVGGGLPEADCTEIQLCRDNVFYAALPDHGLYKSEDAGATWQKLENGLDNKTFVRVAATLDRPDIVYAAAFNDDGCYGSQDGGKSFHLLTHTRYNSIRNWPANYRQHESFSAKTFIIDPNDPYTLYLDYQCKTHDGGQSWVHYGMKEISTDRWQTTGLTILTQYRAVFDPNRPNYVWFGFSDTGLMLSEDRGNSIINLITYHRGEVNQGAYWRDRLVRSSGSCQTVTVDPDLSTTIYATISGKNADSRSSVGGIIIKSVDSGWNWRPIYEKHGLDDGIARSIIIDPSSPKFNRTVYVASYANGVYKSTDDGNSFKKMTKDKMFRGNTRIMWLSMAPSNPQVLYMAVGGSYGIRPITFGPKEYPQLEPGMYGGLFKTTNGGKSWEKCNKTREIPSIQDVAVHPFDENIVYAAAYHEPHLKSDDHAEWGKGGVYKTIDGGKNWEVVFEPTVDDFYGQGEVEGVDINPVDPDIVYATVRRYGIYRTLDGGKTWDMVGKKGMDRRQRRFHSIDLNPHDPSEMWVAHFGNSFSKGIDYKAKKQMEDKLLRANFVRNSGFEKMDASGLPKQWKIEQPPVPKHAKPVVSINRSIVKDGGNSLRFHLTEPYLQNKLYIPAVREQIRMMKSGELKPNPRRNRNATEFSKKNIDRTIKRQRAFTNTWLYQKIHPYYTTLSRNRRIAIEMDVYVADRNLPKGWGRGSEQSEVPREPPQVYVTEVRDYNVHWVVAETALSDLEALTKIPSPDMKGKWYHCRAIGRVSDEAQSLRVTISGVGLDSGLMDLYVDNIQLSIVE